MAYSPSVMLNAQDLNAKPGPADKTFVGTASIDELMPLVYEELRRVAHRHMANERDGHTLQTTALVNEAYLKLKEGRFTPWQSRTQFFSVAAEMMRQVLVDHARRHARLKRGGGVRPIPLDEALHVAEDRADELLLVHDALKHLEQFDPRKSQIAVMRFFAGLSVKETADALAVSEETVTRDWRVARALLRRWMSTGGAEDAAPATAVLLSPG